MGVSSNGHSHALGHLSDQRREEVHVLRKNRSVLHLEETSRRGSSSSKPKQYQKRVNALISGTSDGSCGS